MQHKNIILSTIALTTLMSVSTGLALNTLQDHGLSCAGAAIGGRIVSYALDKNEITTTKTQALAAGATVSLAAIIARRATEISKRTIGIGEIFGDLFFTAVGYALTTMVVPVQDKKKHATVVVVEPKLGWHKNGDRSY